MCAIVLRGRTNRCTRIIIRRTVSGSGLPWQDFRNFAPQHHCKAITHMIDHGQMIYEREVGDATRALGCFIHRRP